MAISAVHRARRVAAIAPCQARRDLPYPCNAAGRRYSFPATRSKTSATADGRESSGE
jgi:hypothetical protein